MDGWMVGWRQTDEQSDGWIGGWMSECIYTRAGTDNRLVNN